MSDQTTQTTETGQTTPSSGSQGADPTQTTQTSTTNNQTQQTDQGTQQTDETLLGAKQPEKTDAGKTDKPVVPDKYADFKVPDGYELDEGVAAEAGTLFKSLGLTQEQGQQLIDMYAKHAIESTTQAQKLVRETRDGWQAAAKALPEIGGELGPGGKVNVAVSRMLDSLGDAKLANEFRAAMNITGAGDHPAFIQVMYKLAQQLGEGTPVKGNSASPFGQRSPGQGERPSAAKALYPNLA